MNAWHLVAVLCTVAACNNVPSTGARDTLASAVRLQAAVDSVVAVGKAAALLRSHGQDSLEVYSYDMDSTGVLVSLLPICPPSSVCLGGGGLVRVKRDGTAELEQLYR